MTSQNILHDFHKSTKAHAICQIFAIQVEEEGRGEIGFGIYRDNLGNKVLTSDDQTLN